ncbi:MAG: hypothetical protein QN178_04590 [Armatimonadota bacterium]|nr:hypothetical protein [Armatimonadota bacterium]
MRIVAPAEALELILRPFRCLRDAVIVVVFPDHGGRYLSAPLWRYDAADAPIGGSG